MTEQEKKNLSSHAKFYFLPGMRVKCAFDGITREFRGGMYVNKEGSVVSLDGDIFFYYAPTDKWAETENQELNCNIKRGMFTVTKLENQQKVKINTEEEKLIRRFPSGAVRSNNSGRPRPDWVSPYAIEAISMRMVGNVSDFGAANYLLGIPEEDCLESLVRHVEELKEAILITKDPAAIKDLAGAVGFNATALLHTIILKEKGLYKEVYPETQVLPVSEAKKDLTYVKK